MSTILDALRKLQREKTAANPSRDLRGSVTDEIPFPQNRLTPPRRGRALGGLALSLAVLAAVGGFWLYKRGGVSRSNGPPAQQVAQPPAPAEQPVVQGEGQAGPQGGEDRPATEAELDQMQREMEMDAATAPEPDAEPPPVAASPEVKLPPALAEKDGPPTAEAEAAAERARLEEIRRAAAAADQARRDAEANAQAQAAAAAAPPPTLAPPPPPPPAAAAKPVTKPKPKPAAKPPEPARREPKPEPEAVDSALAMFPAVRVESIRWHPLPERRAASLRFEQQNAADAHEGDIVGGVLVYRIEPGAVELRVGSTSRVVRPTP